MRLSVVFKCEYIPIAYQMLGVSLIKEALKNTNKEYFENIYEFNGKINKKSKNFCFSIFINNYEMYEDKFKVNGDIIFNISTSDLEFGINLYNGLLKIKNFNYKEFKLIKKKVMLNKEKQITKEEVVFKTLSPIFIKNKNNKPLLPQDQGFQDELNYILNLELENLRGYGLKRLIQLELIQIAKKVVKEDIREFNNKASKDIFYVNCFSGIIKLKGDMEDLRDIYLNGIGFKRNQGFGMIEVM